MFNMEFNQTHHAVVYVGDTSLKETIKKYISPDVVLIEQEVLDIGTVRKVIEKAYQKPIQEEYLLIVVCVTAIAPEAQQALLKILEEPPITSKFAFFLPNTSGILPTVLSRVLVVEDKKDCTLSTEIIDFIKLNHGQRLDLISDKAKKKDNLWFKNMIEGIGFWSENKKDKTKEFSQALLTALLYVNFAGSSKKMLLENLALSLSVEK